MKSKHKKCPICKHIPNYKFVEILHGSDRLPPQVDDLITIGGYRGYGGNQVRKCPNCGTFYRFLHEHDSESGVGYGYTDEDIERLTPEKALGFMEANLPRAEEAVVYWTKQYEEYGRKHAQQFVKSHQEEVERLKDEIAKLK